MNLVLPGIGDGTTAIAGNEIEAINDAVLQECLRDVDVLASAFGTISAPA